MPQTQCLPTVPIKYTNDSPAIGIVVEKHVGQALIIQTLAITVQGEIVPTVTSQLVKRTISVEMQHLGLLPAIEFSDSAVEIVPSGKFHQYFRRSDSPKLTGV